MASETISRGWGCTARAGSEVRTTQMVRVAGSAQAIVPVEPLCPKVFSEQPLPPADGPMFHPKPRGVRPGGLWLFTISLAVSGFRQAPVSFRNWPRNFARSGAEACAPPQGAPNLRHHGL